ncbi:ribonuclease HII [Abditibacteriota bacterium]|nr:ribonuclease HII [Abditibacteriota bacterium]
MPTFEHEVELHHAGYARVAGVDEAGRGPLAGPVVAGAAILSYEFAARHSDKLNDSKQLSAKERERLYEEIRNDAHWGIGIVSAAEIDEMNIRRASWEAMRRSLQDLQDRFEAPDYALVDGLPVREMEWEWPYEALVKGDSRSLSIAAGSILAKVTRDAMMEELAQEFVGYGFARHKGYPTPQHYAALRELGPCVIHRQTFAPVRAEAVRLGLIPAPAITVRRRSMG